MVKYLLLVAILSAVFWFVGVAVFFLHCVPIKQRRRDVESQTDAQHLAADLSNQATQLDELRLWMFLEWMQCHCCGDQTEWVSQDEGEIQNYLSRWLESFFPDDRHAEHHLIMTEINWWKTADDKTLLRCIGEEFMEKALAQ